MLVILVEQHQTMNVDPNLQAQLTRQIYKESGASEKEIEEEVNKVYERVRRSLLRKEKKQE